MSDDDEEQKQVTMRGLLGGSLGDRLRFPISAQRTNREPGCYPLVDFRFPLSVDITDPAERVAVDKMLADTVWEIEQRLFTRILTRGRYQYQLYVQLNPAILWVGTKHMVHRVRQLAERPPFDGSIYAKIIAGDPWELIGEGVNFGRRAALREAMDELSREYEDKSFGSREAVREAVAGRLRRCRALAVIEIRIRANVGIPQTRLKLEEEIAEAAGFDPQDMYTAIRSGPGSDANFVLLYVLDDRNPTYISQKEHLDAFFNWVRADPRIESIGGDVIATIDAGDPEQYIREIEDGTYR